MRWFYLSLTFCALLAAPLRAQTPPPIDLGIQNIPQETQVWCWVAVVEQIVHWKTGSPPPMTPHQCELVSYANGMPQPLCCQGNPFYANQCLRTGHTQEIMGLIGATGAGVATFNPPADPMTLYNTLASGRPIILQLQQTPFQGHVVVLRGMSWVQTAFGVQPVLHINDPLSHFTQPVLFQDLLPLWSAAIVVN